MSRKRPLVIVTEPIEVRLEWLRGEIDTLESRGARDAATASRWVVTEIEDALREAAAVWMPTADAAKATGWTRATLSKWASRKLAGKSLPPAWKQIQCRNTSGGYCFRVSSLPLASRKSAA